MQSTRHAYPIGKFSWPNDVQNILNELNKKLFNSGDENANSRYQTSKIFKKNNSHHYKICSNNLKKRNRSTRTTSKTTSIIDG